MVNHQPLKLQNTLFYSGDIITLDNSNPLLLEILPDQTIKLRSIEKDKYLSKKTFSRHSLDFLTDFGNAITFTIKSDNKKISLQRKNSERDKHDKYLGFDKDFCLSLEEKWLTVTKKENVKEIVKFEEKITNFQKKEERKTKVEKLLIACKSYDNQSDDVLKHTFKFSEVKQREHSFTSSDDFTWGISGGLKLDCTTIGGLEIGGSLEKKSGTSNTITKTDTVTIEENYDVPCQPWKKVRVKLVAKKVELLTLYTATVKRVIGGRDYEYLVDGEYLHDEYFEQVCSHEAITARNILLVGWTGSGKSTLANVLSNSKNFQESDKSTPETKWGKPSEEFEWRENYYCVIDNIGFGDTEVNEKQELIRIGKAISEASQGLSHVLFVYKKRFSDKEKEAFGKLAALKITESLITVVRSNFDNFESKEKCREDKKSLKNESSEIREVLNNCRGFLHVNNDEEEDRNTSRKIVLDHLHDSCEKKPFKPEEWKEWNSISNLIENYFAERKVLENKKDQADTSQKEAAIKQQIAELETNTAEQVKKEIQTNEIFRLAQIIQEAK